MAKEYYVYPDGTPIAIAGNNEYATQIPMSASDATDVYTAISGKADNTNLPAVQGGTDLTLVTTGDKYNWDNNDASNKVSKSGDTMTGRLYTSFNNAVAMGTYGAHAQTIPDLCEELRFSSGCGGSVSINTAYNNNGITIPTGWYNFLWIPHRNGGDSGVASGDNCNYGMCILSGMTVDGAYRIRFVNSSIYVSYLDDGTADFWSGGATTKIKIKINSTVSWMLAFTVTLYQGYRATKILISGYQYGTNHWYDPSARLLGDTDNNESISVYFGYDSTNNLWVGFDGGNYTGVHIDSVCNGYTQVNRGRLFTISNVTAFGGTTQTTVTASSRAHYAVYAGSADSAINATNATKSTYAALTNAGSTSGTTAKAFTVPAAATEIIVTGRFSSKILSASIPKALLTSSNQEIWLTGGRGPSSGSGFDGALRCLCYLKISSTTLTLQGITVNDQNVDKTSATTWNVFYR